MSPKPTADLPNEHPSFTVTVEHEIGRVQFGGSEHPFVAAMDIVARYHANTNEGAGEPREAVYRFPGWQEGETIRVGIEHEGRESR